MSDTHFKPYIPPEKTITEFTLKGLVLGSVLGIVFAASSVYLALKVGLTVSASIPIAVLSITIFRAFGRATILENNMVQTVGSAGESIAAGIAFTLPSLLLMGQDLEFMRVLLVAVLGGFLGVLMMIPLRQGLIVQEHGKLTYPEGTACADVLIVGEKGGTSAKTVFMGAAVGFGYGFLNLVTRFWKDTSDWALDRLITPFKGALISAEVSPTLLGVGYIIGSKTAANMMAGGSLAFVVIIPLIHVFGDAINQVIFPATKLIRDMSPGEIRNAYVLYIGAGAVATGGFISLARSIPSIIGAFKRGLGSLAAMRRGGVVQEVPRTERDIPLIWVLGGCLALIIAIWAAPMLEINFLSAILIVLFGFFFVTVSSRITGEIGSSSNPISGMTVATLLITCLLFLAVGWTGVSYRAMALTTAAIVCVAASNGGTISQSLKTGFLVGATPKWQQIGILVGALTSALVIGYTVLYLDQAKTTITARDYPQFTATVPADAENVEVDGKQYKKIHIPEPTNGVPTGRYLADAQGKIVYVIDPGVCGVDVERPERVSGSEYTAFRAGALPETGETFLMADGPARILHLTTGQGGVEPGRYLLAADGSITHRLISVTKFDAPKARLFSLIIDGILTQKLPWALVLVGVVLAIVMELVRVSSLPFAVGLYLPISTSTPIFIGGLVRYIVDRRRKTSEAEAEFSPGVLLSSGLIAGGAIAGLFQAVVQGGNWDAAWDKSSWLGRLASSELWTLLPFAGLAFFLLLIARGRNNKKAA
ncbi:MAG: oligopeptide transporter, OPT family [Candidatus Zixiibacteriota bacterium]